MKRVLILLILFIFLTGCSKHEVKQEIQVPETTDSSLKDPSGLTKETCTGYWNECSSPCYGTNAEVCIQQCVPRCECYDAYFCPQGYACKKGSYGNKGVCVKIK